MRRTAYFAVLGSAVLCYTALGAVLKLIPGLVDDRLLVGLMVGAPALTAVITRPAGGRIADRVGAAPVMFVGAVVMALGIAPALASASTGALLASRLLVGAGEGAMMAAAVLWLLRLAGPDRRGAALGHIGLANYAGLTAGPPLASAFGESRTPVLVAAAILPLAGILVAARVERPSAEPEPESSPAVLKDVLAAGVALTLVNVGYAAFLAFGPSASGTGLSIPVFAAGVIGVRTFGAKLPDRLGGARTILFAAPLASAGLVVVAATSSPLPSLIGTAVLAVGQGLAVPALGLIALSGVPQEQHGAAAGMFFAFFDGGVGAGGPLSGVVARLSSPAAALFAAAGAVFAAGLVGTVASRSKPRRHRSVLFSR